MPCRSRDGPDAIMTSFTKLLLASLLWLAHAGLVSAETVTLNLKDADISALISTVAEVTDRNFIIDPRVKGKVTVISTRPMDSDEVLEARRVSGGQSSSSSVNRAIRSSTHRACSSRACSSTSTAASSWHREAPGSATSSCR